MISTFLLEWQSSYFFSVSTRGSFQFLLMKEKIMMIYLEKMNIIKEQISNSKLPDS